MKMFNGATGSAKLSPCGLYRTTLTRTWDTRPVLVVCMFNPSTADWRQDDPTIHLVCQIASHNGFGGIVVVNGIPLRSPTPSEAANMVNTWDMRQAWDERDRLFQNVDEIKAQVEKAGAVLLAWGALADRCPDWFDHIIEQIREVLPDGARLTCLGKTKGGHPKHPPGPRRAQGAARCAAPGLGDGMTKPASIMLVKRHPLDGFSEFERSIIRRFLFDCFRGADEQNEGRWRRLWSRFWNAEPGELFQWDNLVERSHSFHSRHMAIEQRLFNSQDYFINLPALRDWLKTGAAFVTWEHDGKGGLVAVPRSTSYEKCSDDEMRELHEAVLAYLRTPGAQEKLWGHLPAARRGAMLESVLADREKGGQA